MHSILVRGVAYSTIYYDTLHYNQISYAQPPEITSLEVAVLSSTAGW
jgi:hypothetical protein